MARPKERTTVCDSGIVCLTFSPDRKRAAFSPNNHLVYIADCGVTPSDCTTWTVTATLERHDHPVTGVHWCPHSNLILTCSQDRTSFVWKEEGTAWSPSMVMLDTTVQKGVTVCCWSANGQKAYFGSASANVVVGTYDSSNDWWHCRAIDKHGSTVTSLAPHPTVNTVLASGGTDCAVMLLSTHTKTVDGKLTDGPKFGTVVSEFRTKAWVHSLSWTPSGQVLAAATHDSRVQILTFSSATNFANPVVQTLSLNTLPLTSLAFLSDTQLVGGGFDYYAELFTVSAQGLWKLSGKWIAESEQKKIKSEAELAREKFQNQASTGQAAAVELPKSRHKNTITSITPLVDVCETAISQSHSVHVFATASMDGRVEYWDMKSLVLEK